MTSSWRGVQLRCAVYRAWMREAMTSQWSTLRALLSLTFLTTIHDKTMVSDSQTLGVWGVWEWGGGGGSGGAWHTCSIPTNSNYEGYSWMHCGTPRLCVSKATCVSDINGAIKTKWKNWQNHIDAVIPLTSMPYSNIMNITNRNEWLYYMALNVTLNINIIPFSFLYGFLNTKYLHWVERRFLRGGGLFDNDNGN